MVNRNLLDKDFYEIHDRYGEKYIHVFGYAYETDSSVTDNPDEIYRVLDYCGFEVPLSEFISDDFDYDVVQCRLNQYIGDYTEDALDEYLTENSRGCIEVPYDNLTMEIPCGNYYG